MARTNDLFETGPGGTYIQTISPSGYDILINGSNKYLNFNTTVGSSGYGIRDNAGTMEFKNSGGSWTGFGSGGGTPGGSNTQLQYNNSGAFGGMVGIIYDSAQDQLKISGGAGFNYQGIDQFYLQGVKYNWPGSQGGPSTFLQNDGSGNLSWASVSSGGVSSVASGDGSILVTNPTTTVDLAVVSSPKLTTARSIYGSNFDGTADLTGPIIGTYGGTGVNNGAKTFTFLKNISFTAADDSGVYTLPTGTKTLLATDGAGTGLSGIPYTLTGTANQVILSAGTGNITFSLPQSIATSSTPTFASMTLTAASALTLGTASSLAGAVLFKNATNANVLTLISGVSASSFSITLPTTAGTNGYFLQTNGSGVTAWAAALTNPMTTTGDIIYSSDNSGTPARLGIGGAQKALYGGTTPSYKFTNFTLFDHYATVGNVGSGEDDLYSDTIAANQLTNNGDKCVVSYGGVANASGVTLKAYFAGTAIFNSGSFGGAGVAWDLEIMIIRVSSTTARVIASFYANGISSEIVTYTALTSQDFTTTNVIKITGTGSFIPSDNDITATLGTVIFQPAA